MNSTHSQWVSLSTWPSCFLLDSPAKDLVMGLSAHDQTFALRVDLKEITELSGVKKQAGAELYPKLSKKFKKVRKKCEKHQIFRKLAADSSADASADEVGRINMG